MSKEDMIKRAQAAYQRNWRKNNPERAKAIQEKYWLKKAKEMEEQKSDTK